MLGYKTITTAFELDDSTISDIMSDSFDLWKRLLDLSEKDIANPLVLRKSFEENKVYSDEMEENYKR